MNLVTAWFISGVNWMLRFLLNSFGKGEIYVSLAFMVDDCDYVDTGLYNFVDVYLK